MMSTAILMTAGTEQTKVSLVSADLSSDQGAPEEISFAKSFQERVGVSALSQEKNTADETAIALPGWKGTTLTKQPEEVAGRSREVNGEPNTAQEMFVHSELKGVAAGKITQPQMTTVTGAQVKSSTGNAETMNVDASAQVDETANDASLPSPTAYATPGPEAKAESLRPQVSTADADQPLVSGDDRPGVLKETETADKVIEGVSSKKTAKAQESSATPKSIQKSGGKIVGGTGIESKPVVGISGESAIPVVGQVVAPTVAPQGEISKATETLSEAVSAVTKPSTGFSPATIDGPVRKEVASGMKASVTDTAMMVTAGSDPVASPKNDMSPEKMPAVVIRSGSDGENKPQVLRESGAALSHSVGIVQTAFVSGNTLGDLGAAKLPVGDAGTHTAGLSAGSREQDGPGVVAQSMDGAPRIVASTPTSLEVGIQNGTHGWLKVRAEMTDGGVVNASVSATSSSGQEMLHRELPAITAYLQEEKVGVNAVTVHAPSFVGSDARSSSGTGGAGGQTPQRSNEGGGQDQNLRKATLNGSDETMTYRGLPGVNEDGSLSLAAYANGGNWLSVRA
jgi:hypothetical protein